MMIAVDAGVAAAQAKLGEEISDARKEEWKKRKQEHSLLHPDVQPPVQRLKTVHEDNGAMTDTDASMRSSTTAHTGNKSRHLVGPDQQQLDYRDRIDEGSVASMAEGSLSSRNTWKSKASMRSHQQQLTDRRQADKDKYAAMTRDEKRSYNAKRRDKYHRQSQESRQKHRERERNRYHHSRDGSVVSEADVKERQARRDKLALERQQRSKQAATKEDSAPSG